jgi:hypothetical protein
LPILAHCFVEPLEQVWPTIYMVRATSAKFGLCAGSMKFVAQDEE